MTEAKRKKARHAGVSSAGDAKAGRDGADNSLGALFGGAAATGSVAELLGGAAPVTAAAVTSPAGGGGGGLSSTFTRLFAGGGPASSSSSSSRSRVDAPKGAVPVAAVASASPGATEAGSPGVRKRGRSEEVSADAQKGKEGDEGESKADAVKKRKPTPAEEKERQVRTLFIGNVPLAWDKKDLKTALRKAVGDKYTGQFKPIWFRAVPVKEKWTHGNLRKAGSILKEYDDRAADAKHAYVVLESADAVPAVRFAIHGFEADRRHKLRADGVGESAKLQTFDRKRSVFVGNLPSNVGEADLRAVFEQTGEVNAVRVVRDKVTKQCKGIAFVMFKDRDSVKAALWHWGAEIKGRPIRVTRVEQRGGNEEGADMDANGANPSHPAAWRIEKKLRRRRIKKPQGAVEHGRNPKAKKGGRSQKSGKAGKANKSARKAKR